MSTMAFDDALEAAVMLAGSFGVSLGHCLFADGAGEGRVWLMAFDIVDGPSDWCWSIILDGAGSNCTQMFATHRRPISFS